MSADVFFLCFAANPKRARLFHDKSLADVDTYEPFLRSVITQLCHKCWLWLWNWSSSGEFILEVNFKKLFLVELIFVYVILGENAHLFMIDVVSFGSYSFPSEVIQSFKIYAIKDMFIFQIALERELVHSREKL